MCARWPFDRAVGEEERSRDLAIRLALGDERGDALLGGSERAGRRRAAADPLELGAGTLGPERGADPLEDRERLLERLPRLAAALRATLCSTEREQRAAAVERELDLRMPLERLLVRRERVLELARLRGEQARGSARSWRAPTRARVACAFPSYQSSSSTASSRRPSSISASTWSTTKRDRAGLGDAPLAARRRRCGSS